MQMLSLMDRESDRTLKLWDGRTTMRTLADGLAKLNELGSLAHDGQAEIRTMPMLLPNGERSAVVAVMGVQRKSGWGIAMPSAAHFDATETRGLRQRYEISRLNGAIVDADGNVELPEGIYVHNVELRPTRLAYQLTALQQQILRHTICFLKAEDRCYQYMDESVLPGYRALNYHAIAELGNETHSSLKAIERYVIENMPTVSRQTIAAALANAGLRRPRSGPRAA